MTKTTATLATKYAQKYMTQVCKHWSHKFETTCDDKSGTAHLPGGAVYFEAKTDSLTIDIALKDETVRERMQAVVAEHLERFAFREAPLGLSWS